MKFPLTALLVVAVSVLTSAKPHKAPLLGPAGPPISSTARCSLERWPGAGPVTVTNSYIVTAVVDETVSRICSRLWHNLSRFSSCGAITKPWCDDHSRDDRVKILNWGFTLTALCDEGAVSSAWYEATRNRYGKIKC
ncbi:hypothetical protein CGRA01v4_00560 [Colletotrichum graminicola]|uniref:Avirulence Effector AvrLm4-7 domain-containing protein n=1 Tax=Colletotrichum graminicola (strain M1.001 / M2 / FGSC 10212) TaxID=645133 RepID=E3QQ35_COLGM|nr:uncharacterized protein GLRG_08117 [Colletotrichum graminicola M1.001]EFQ32973.1 hypothetical protein GLRG_08117 [Colletotrichum graminicola M1.001]WDK09282.1 hypothetical protein CGRA01v4_00560 [Colletotrichum graminicola]